MIDLQAPDPFSLASWHSNVMPVGDPSARAWWLASLLAAICGRPVIDELAERLAAIAPRASA